MKVISVNNARKPITQFVREPEHTAQWAMVNCDPRDFTLAVQREYGYTCKGDPTKRFCLPFKITLSYIPRFADEHHIFIHLARTPHGCFNQVAADDWFIESRRFEYDIRCKRGSKRLCRFLGEGCGPWLLTDITT